MRPHNGIEPAIFTSFFRKNVHIDESDPAAIEAIRIRNNIKRRAKETTEVILRIEQIYNRFLVAESTLES